MEVFVGRKRRKELPPAYHGLVAQSVWIVLIFHIRNIFRRPKGMFITILSLKRKYVSGLNVPEKIDFDDEYDHIEK